MPKTKLDIKNELKTAANGSRNFEDMIDKLANYIILNYRLKKVTVTTVEDEEIKNTNEEIEE